MSASTVRDEFWKLPLSQLNDTEWEALCDHCGRCCLKKLQDEDTEEIYWTRVICRFHEEENSRCGCYGERTKQVPDCLDVKKMTLSQIQWMPPTCAYRLRMENKPLQSWHPLLSGSSARMEEEGISVKGKTLSEEHVHELGYHEHLIKWV